MASSAARRVLPTPPSPVTNFAEMGKSEFAQTFSASISASRPANSEIAVRHCSKEKTSGLACSARHGTGRSIGMACPWR